MAPEKMDDWIRSLQDSGNAAADETDELHARATREYFLRRIEEDDVAENSDSGRQERLLAYFRKGTEDAMAVPKQNVLPDTTGGTTTSGRPRTAANQPWFAIAASILIAAAVVPIAASWLTNKPPEPDEEVFRGGVPSFTIVSDSPDKTLKDIERRLAKIGAVVKVSKKGDAILLEVKVPKEKSGDAQSLLTEFGITVPSNGVLVLTITR